MTDKSKANGKELTTTQPTLSDRFTSMVVKEYSANVSNIQLSPLQRKLAQHLFIKVDMALKDLEKKRLSKSGGDKKTSFSWDNINLPKLATDAVYRIDLGLDALIPNHIHPIPYFNGKLSKYDLDLRIGYVGRDYYYRMMSLYPIKDIEYHLVCESDEFEVLTKSANNGVESYNLKIKSPFDRGNIVGGFGYIIYEEDHRNKLVLVTTEGFKKSQKKAMSNDFWGNYPEEMKYKTIVHRTVSKIVLDPMKINKSFAQVEQDEYEMIEHRAFEEAEAEITQHANQGEVIDIDQEPEPDENPEEPPEGEPISEEEAAEIHEREMAEAEEQEQEAAAGGPGF